MLLLIQMLICCQLYLLLSKPGEMQPIRNLQLHVTFCLSTAPLGKTEGRMAKMRMDMMSPLGLDGMRSQHELFYSKSQVQPRILLRKPSETSLFCFILDLTWTDAVRFVYRLSPGHSHLIFYSFSFTFFCLVVHRKKTKISRRLAGIPGWRKCLD